MEPPPHPCSTNRIETPGHGDSNEKAQNHGTHLAGRRDPALRRRRRFPLQRLGRALSDPRWPGCNPRRVWCELRSTAWPSHLRPLVGLLAKGAEQSDGGRLQWATKYVATHRPESLEWGPFEGLGPDLIVWGSSTLTPVLLEHGLADEVMLLVYPVLLGKGKRFVAEGTPPRAFELDSTKALPFHHQLLQGRGAFEDRIVR